MIWLCVALGGAVGTTLRYGVSLLVANHVKDSFPYHTLAVNVVGSCVMGMLAAYFLQALEQLRYAQELKAFLVIGVLGGFTTFSAFSYDAISLYQSGYGLKALIYIIASVVLSIGAAAVGYISLK